VEWSSQIQAPTVLPQEKKPIPSEQENVWDPEPRWAGQSRKKLFSFRDSNPWLSSP